MSKLLFRMRNVPDDEASEVRQLLEANDIEFFETHAGNWGISMPAIWLADDSQFKFARELLDNYQADRARRMRREYELSRERGEIRTMWHTFVENPLRFVLYLALIATVLYFSLRFFFSF